MPRHEDVQAVQCFLICARLTHKDIPWEWSQEQGKAFEKIKKAVSTTPVLKFFSPDFPGEGDASEKGIGFALTQEGQPVTYESRDLTKAQQNYS